MAYDNIEPFGDQRADLRAGIISSTIFNMGRGKKAKAMGPIDFMAYVKRPDKSLDLTNKIKAVFSSFKRTPG